MGTDWTPERDAELIAHFGLDDPDSLLPEDKIRIAVHDLRAAWLDAEAALTMARARADAAAEERDAARDAFRSDERQLCDELILARRERDEAKRALGEVEGAVAERMQARLDAMAAETGRWQSAAERLERLATEGLLVAQTRAAERDAALARAEKVEHEKNVAIGSETACAHEVERLAAKVAHMRSIAQGARAAAYVLAYSYTHDVRPPQRVVDEALAWRDDARAGGRTAALRGEGPGPCEPAASLTRADVEARFDAVLSGSDFERTVPRFARAASAFVQRFDHELEDRTPTIDLVCAVLGVSDAG